MSDAQQGWSAAPPSLHADSEGHAAPHGFYTGMFPKCTHIRWSMCTFPNACAHPLQRMHTQWACAPPLERVHIPLSACISLWCMRVPL
eukprot:52475-Chlamydomonas_euryale.AAC.1